ncbi:hypothetical protein B0J13DRAFT_297540 [Dactylonectria estremocensis]|uniref:Fe2OG dioxygenase domain-containing protein n=1 Tax=Dactylonectria estremocensis TaxID=1079267 RepID=A0A9P9J895_9HYPO|nr:hypothetical protein B0J13DRAFT_297540 [Dactylonectria estremocensis]
MLSNLASKLGLSPAQNSSFVVKPRAKSQGKAPIQVTYTHNDVPIPDTFLTTPLAKPITTTRIDWASTPLPENEGRVALVLDNVLSQEECKQMIALAEDSVPREVGEEAWRPAMVSLGPGWEAPAPGYRESDRIIWNQQVIVDRLWERCAQSEGLRELLAVVPPQSPMGGGKWEFRRYNERMRFLKYSPGQYFKPHCDGPYWYEDGKKEFQTHYTVHLYFNDSVDNDPQSDLQGGATSFLARKGDRRVDVNPKAGSVLIFQHRGLFHEGAEVTRGTKYTMRTDILYEWVPDVEPTAETAEETAA